MKTIAISKWMAYVPFRTSAPALREMGVELDDGKHDRVEGLLDGRYAAAPLSTYALIEALPKLGDRFGVAWIAVMPVGSGSDRIICRSDIVTAADLHRSRIGVTPYGLERYLFEHIFDAADLPVKTDYVELPNRDEYRSAFIAGRIDTVMAPQPVRSQLLAAVPGTSVFEADADLPPGLYAPLVFHRSAWTPEELTAVQRVFVRAASELSELDDEALRQAYPPSFEGIDRPAAEVRATLHWPSEAESARYFASTGPGSFLDHLRLVGELRARRFSQSPLPETLLALLPSGGPSQIAMQMRYELGALVPQDLMKMLHPLPDAADAMDVSKAFHAMERDGHITQNAYDDFHIRHLARYRILEWEIFIRDLMPDAKPVPFQCYFATHAKRLTAILPEDARKSLITSARASTVSRSKSPMFVDERIREDLDSFRNLPPESIRTPYPDVHGALFLYLLGLHEKRPLLIPDGELTFFSLVWLLRQRAQRSAEKMSCTGGMNSKAVALTTKDNRGAMLSRFTVDIKGDPSWAEADLATLLEQTGVIVRASESTCFATQRYESLVSWLYASPPSQIPPLKFPNNDFNGREVQGVPREDIIRFAETVRSGLATLRSARPPRLPTRKELTISQVAEHLGQLLLDPFDDAFTPLVATPPPGCGVSPWYGHDHLVFCQARPAFFPWEFLLRSWQPFPTHLLILPIGSSPLDKESQDYWSGVVAGEPPTEAPFALAYVTIAGKLPSSIRFRKWLAAYWALFQGLTSEWVVDQIEKDARGKARDEARLDAARKLHSASEPFALYMGHLRRFLDAAVEVRKYVDPLTIDTSPLQAAKLVANGIFDWSKDDGAHKVCHSLTDLTTLSNEDARRLDDLLHTLFNTLERDRGVPLIKQVSAFRKSRVEAGGADVRTIREDLWILAHSLYKQSISLWVLTGEGSERGKWLSYSNEPDPSDSDAKTRCEDYLAVAALQLAEWKESGFSFSMEETAEGGSILSIVPSGQIGNWDQLKSDVIGYITGSRRRSDHGGNASEPWARVLRGCAGHAPDAASIEKWLQKNVENLSATVKVGVLVYNDVEDRY